LSKEDFPIQHIRALKKLDLLLLLNEQNRAWLQFLSSLSPICPNDTIKISTATVLKEKESPYSLLALTSFSPSLTTLYDEVNNHQGEATMGKSILTSRAPASKEELQYRE
jgi:hypothetical protein